MCKDSEHAYARDKASVDTIKKEITKLEVGHQDIIKNGVASVMSYQDIVRNGVASMMSYQDIVRNGVASVMS